MDDASAPEQEPAHHQLRDEYLGTNETAAGGLVIPEFVRMDGLRKGSGRNAKAKRRRGLGRTGSLSSSSSASPASSGPPSPRDDDGDTAVQDSNMADEEEVQGAERKLDSLRVDPSAAPAGRHVHFDLETKEIPRTRGTMQHSTSVEGRGGVNLEGEAIAADEGSLGDQGMQTDAAPVQKSEPSQNSAAHDASGQKQVEWGDANEGMDSSGDEEQLGHVGKESEELYDPDMDDLDQQFVDNRRRRHQPGYSASLKHGPPKPKKPKKAGDGLRGGETGAGEKSKEGGGEWKAYVAPNGYEYYHNSGTGETTWIKPAGYAGDNSALTGPKLQSDAILSCPCCFSIVCLDCQQHQRYHTQFRAVFVQNCEVLRGETLQAEGPKGLIPSDTVAPVRCKACHAEIGVMDREEVFHFFDVIPSNG